jgi:dGTPase
LPPLPFAIAEYAGKHDLWLGTYASAEAKAAAIADDIAYNTHDVDDGLRAGLLTLDGLAEVAFIGDHLAAIRRQYPGLSPTRTRAELIRRMISALVSDVIDESRRRLSALAPSSADDIRHAGRTLIGFSEAMAVTDTAIKARLRRDVYREAGVLAVMNRAETVVMELFGLYRDNPSALPEAWQQAEGGRARIVADFLAGMTDRYALLEHQRFFGGSPELR